MHPKNRKIWDEKIAAQWPNEWARANTSPNKSKKRSNLRRRFIAAHEHEKFVEKNPNASCGNCRFNVRHSDKYPHICDLGWEKGGWFQPISDQSDVCKKWGAQS